MSTDCLYRTPKMIKLPGVYDALEKLADMAEPEEISNFEKVSSASRSLAGIVDGELFEDIDNIAINFKRIRSAYTI